MDGLKLHLSRSPSYIWAGALMLALSTVALLRSHTFHEPLEADESIMAVVAQDWMTGGQPYVTAFENKPIGAFMIYRAAISLWGYDEIAPKVAALIAMALSTCFLWLVLGYWDLTSRSRVALLFLWTPLTVWVPVFANGCNTEVFLLPCILASLYALLRDKGLQGTSFLLSLLILSVSLLIKQVTLPFLAVPFLIQGSRFKKGSSLWFFLVFSSLLFIGAFHLLIYGIAGYPPTFLLQQLHENGSYVIQMNHQTIFRPLGHLLGFPFNPHFKGLRILTVISLGSIAWSWKVKRHRKDAIVGLYTIAAIVAVNLPGRDLPHYYILFLPFIILGLGSIMEIVSRPWARAAFLSLAAILLVVPTYTQYVSRDPRLISKDKYDAYEVNWFLRDRYIGDMMRKVGFTGASAYVAGDHPGILFYSRNKPATRFFVSWMYSAPALTTPEVTYEQLKAHPPQYCVIPDSRPPLFASWMLKNYRWVKTIDNCLIMKIIPGHEIPL
jgi:hypothetical protein